MPMRLVRTRKTSLVLAVVKLVEEALAQHGEQGQALAPVPAGLLMKAVRPGHGSFAVDQVGVAESAGYSVDQEAL